MAASRYSEKSSSALLALHSSIGNALWSTKAPSPHSWVCVSPTPAMTCSLGECLCRQKSCSRLEKVPDRQLRSSRSSRYAWSSVYLKCQFWLLSAINCFYFRRWLIMCTRPWILIRRGELCMIQESIQCSFLYFSGCLPSLQADLGKHTEQSKNKIVFITGNEKLLLSQKREK